MAVMGGGLETLAGRAGRIQSAEDNDGDGSWAGDTCWEVGQRKSAADNDGDGSWALGKQDNGSRQKTMTVMETGLGTLAWRAGQMKTAEDNDGD